MATLAETLSQLQAGISANPAAAKATFTSRSQLQEGVRTEVQLRQHSLVVDEPASLGGTDQGPNPVELVLAALGTCQEITYRAYATALNIPLEGVSVTVTGDLDLHGFLALDDETPAGFQNIRTEVQLDSPASTGQLAQLTRIVEAHCPVLDTLTRAIQVSSTVKVNGHPLVAPVSA